MESGIYIDDQFIGITGHSVSIYFDVIRAVIDSGRSQRLTLPHDGGYGSFLITPHTKLRSTVQASELPDEVRDVIASNPFGNFPALVRQHLDTNDDRWEFINATDLGAAVRSLDESPQPAS